MKKLLVSSFLLGGILIACAEKQPVPAIPSDPEIEGKIEKLLKNLTLEEKIGQMCELTIGVITDKSGQKLSEDLLDTVIGKYKVGSILNIPFGVSQKKEVFADVITQIQKKIVGRDKNPLYLRIRSDSWCVLYARCYFLSAGYQYGSGF